MDCELALIADYASFDAVGKLNIIGSFRDVYAPPGKPFPISLPQLFIVAIFEGTPIEAGKQKLFHVAIMGPSKKLIWEHEFTQVLPNPDNGSTVRSNIVIQLQAIQFPEPGPYAVYLSVNGDSKRDIRFTVHNAPPVQEPLL